MKFLRCFVAPMKIIFDMSLLCYGTPMTCHSFEQDRSMGLRGLEGTKEA